MSYINSVIKEFLNNNKGKGKTEDVHYFKLPDIWEYSLRTKRISKIYKNICMLDKSVRVIFTTSKIRDYFSTKDSLPECLKSYVIYLFTCAI